LVKTVDFFAGAFAGADFLGVAATGAAFLLVDDEAATLAAGLFLDTEGLGATGADFFAAFAVAFLLTGLETGFLAVAIYLLF
jgi:hypothetical protein